MKLVERINYEIMGIVAEEENITPSLLNENLRNYLASRRRTLKDVLTWMKKPSINPKYAQAESSTFRQVREVCLCKESKAFSGNNGYRNRHHRQKKKDGCKNQK